jgi:hypothetical protein
MGDRISAIKALVKGPGENNVGYGVDGRAWLESGVLSFVAPISASIDPDDGELSLSGFAVNTSTFLNDELEQVAPGKGIVFKASGGAVDVDYRITITAPISGGNSGETREPVVVLQIRDGKQD